MQSLEGTKAFLEGARTKFRSHEDFAVSGFLKDTGRFALSTGLHPRNWHVPSFEIGYWCRRSMQRQGLTTEAVRALTQTALVTMAANRVEIRCDSRNHRSRRVAELAGYRLEAQLRSDDRANDGTLRDTVVYVKLREDFEPQG
jgi:RimJ/RimL family protein N-acetyltransferase